MKKVFVDSNVFIIHLRYKRDENYELNKRFLELIINEKVRAFTSIYNLLEVTGILSFNLNKNQTRELFINFPHIFNTQILFPKNLESCNICLNIENVLDKIYRKMSFLDALILDIFEESRIKTFITWNAKDFKEKTKKEVLTPKEFLKEFK